MSKKLNVYLRQTSNMVENHPRPKWFSYKKTFENLIKSCNLYSINFTIVFDGKMEGTFTDDYVNHSSLDYMDNIKVININEQTEIGSGMKLYEILKDEKLNDDDIVYIVENDYVHAPGWDDVLIDFFEMYSDVGYVSLYDHNDKYEGDTFHQMYSDLTSFIFKSNHCHWRTVPSTTGTYATTYKTLMEDYSIHTAVGGDYNKFLELTNKNGRSIVSSIPGYSTHCVKGLMSPFRNWEKIVNE
tara:strand:+ start:501 stop:1226 length:726 start_codon:yes stop_codon:yes gene_type:complete